LDNKQFEAILPLIITVLLQKIIERMAISEDKAFSLLYHSELYLQLNNESTKVWHYSADKLCALFEEELTLGRLELPEY
jgi:hypothetical protein